RLLHWWNEPTRSIAIHDFLPRDTPHPGGSLFAVIRRTSPPRAHTLPRQVFPVEPENLLKVLGDLFILEDQAGVSVHQGALVRPVVTANQHPGSVYNDPLGVAAILQPDLRHVEPPLLQLLQWADWSKFAADDDPDIHSFLVLGQQGIH